MLVGLAPAVLVVVYYAVTLGFGPVDVVWEAALLIAGHAVSLLAALEWSIVLGCVVSAVTIVGAGRARPRPEQAPVTVRGPSPTPGRARWAAPSRRCDAE